MTFLFRAALALFFSALAVNAHPMGNFSVNHYARIEVGQPATEVLFVLDLAELPSFELMQSWGLKATSPRADLKKRAIAEARTWTRQLQFTVNGKRVTPTFEHGGLVIADGAGGLPVMRIDSHLKLAAEPGTLRYADLTYPDRTAGWKEVVVVPRTGAQLTKSTAGATEKSQALTAYPQDPTLSPPQDLTATVEWKGAPGAPPVMVSESAKSAPVVGQARPVVPSSEQPAERPVEQPVEQPAAPLAPPAAAPARTGATVAEPNAMGQVKRGDFLSQTLQGKEIGWGLGLICVFVAFWFGALHALEPGHGKTMVAAYLVGERGTPKHAILLGGMVTFTHTVSVFILGLLTMFLSRYIMPDVISKWLGVISGLTIAWIGGLLLYRRSLSFRKAAHAHGHSHSHDHGHSHEHVHAPVSAAALHAHSHSHEPGHTHTHEHPHTHEPGHAHSHDHPHEHVHAPVQTAALHTHSHEPGHTHTHEHPHTHDAGHAHSHDHPHEHVHAPVQTAALHTHSHEPGHTHTHEHPHTHEPGHAHSHDHPHEHVHAPVQTAALHTHPHSHDDGHSHSHGPAHGHSHGALTHTHDGHTHSHVIEGEISMKSLIALGASGGLVPCPSALVLLLAAVSVGRTGFGLLLLVSFSLGLALVLMATGLVVLYAKQFLPKRKDTKPNPLFKLMPVISAAVIFLIGVVLTGNALGIIPVIRFFG